MRVNGEIFFLINGWMNYLFLLLAARLGRVRLRRGRLSSVLGSGYALAACGAAVLGLIGLLNRGSLPSREACSVEITLRGKTMRLPALRDSGS